MFPILGGRLLKKRVGYPVWMVRKVSNPWREAIEEYSHYYRRYNRKVSNPWREAIEVTCLLFISIFKLLFPILGGRLLK